MKTLFLFLACPILAFGQSPSPTPSGSKFDPEMLGGTNPTLTEQERAGVEVTAAWRDKSLATLVGAPGSVSSVQFRFGESLPTIVAAILQVTDIELQPGESVKHISLGDSTRWTVESVASGSGSNPVQHLIVKPRDIGLSTSLVVTTDRRTYHLLLVSDEKDFFHYVTFEYAAEPAVLVSASPTPTPKPVKDPPPHKKQADGKQVVASFDPPDDADENYTVHGHAEWSPVSVYSSGGKTYIEMPDSVRHKEAPVLFESKKSGAFHTDKALCNYRVHGKWYVVDRVLDNATLVSGVGYGQQKVTIRHAQPKKKEEEACNDWRPRP